jgi:hypothetical protein
MTRVKTILAGALILVMGMVVGEVIVRWLDAAHAEQAARCKALGGTGDLVVSIERRTYCVLPGGSLRTLDDSLGTLQVPIPEN